MSKIKVCTFNLRTDVESDGINKFTNRHGRVLDCIREQSPDVIGFQEALDSMREWLGDELSPLGYTVVGCGRNADMRGESVAVAFKRKTFELIRLENRWLSATPAVPGSTFGGDQSHCPRLFTAAILKANDCAPFLFLNTHLDHKGKTARFLGAVEVMQYVSEVGLPFVITGDMNAYPGDSELKPFTEYTPCGRPVIDATEGLGGTFHSFGRRLPDNAVKIDYIYTDMPCDVAESYVVDDNGIDGVFISDHRPVCAFVEA